MVHDRSPVSTSTLIRPLPCIAWAPFISKFRKTIRSRSGSPAIDGVAPSMSTSTAPHDGSPRSRRAVEASRPVTSTADDRRLGRARVQQHVLHHPVQRIKAADHFADNRSLRAAGGQPLADHLDRAAHAGEGVLHFMRDDRRHFAELDERGLLAQPLLELHARAEVVQHPGELALTLDEHLAHREVQRECRAVLATARHLAADADDLRVAGREVAGQVGVMLLVIRRGHQRVDIDADELRFRVSEQALGAAIERLDAPARIDHDNAVDAGIDHCVEPPDPRLGQRRRRAQPRRRAEPEIGERSNGDRCWQQQQETDIHGGGDDSTRRRRPPAGRR